MILQMRSIDIRDEYSNKIKVEYSITKIQIERKIIYGFRVETTNENTYEIFYIDYIDFTESLKEAEDIFNMLIKNKVLPFNLINVLDDLVS